jgi:hypothetical protein
LVADATHNVQIGYLLHPGLTAAHSNGAINISRDGKILLTLRPDGKLSSHIHAADSKDCGWYSPTFGVREATARIVLTGVLAPGQRTLTRFSYAHD